MEYRYDDRALDAGTFLALVQQVWPGEYDAEKTRAALARTINITAWDGGRLAGCLRIPHRRLLFWHHHGAAGASRLPAAGRGAGR